jgi:polygalacturonase
MTDFLITSYGAVNDGITLNTIAINQAIEDASKVGGRVVVPAGGSYLSGSIELKGAIEFHLEEGAHLLASPNYDDYLAEHQIPAITNGTVVEDVLPQRSFISAFEAHSVSITGKGVIDGNADGYIQERGRYIHSMRGPVGGKSQYLERPFTVFLIGCDSVDIQDITIKDPAFWALRLTGCNNSAITGISILTDLMVPNADGIDIDRCQNVQITKCNLITADDCISLKSCCGTAQYGAVRNIYIANCFMKSTSGAITLGTESVGVIENVIVTDCVVKDSHRGFAVRAREGGLISNVVFENSIVETRAFSESWWGHGEALHVTAFSWDDPNKEWDSSLGNIERQLEGKVDGIKFNGIRVVSEAAILVWAAHKELLKNIEFNRISLTMKKSSKWPPRIDLRPNPILDFVWDKPSAVTLRNAENITFLNSEIAWDPDTRAEYESAIDKDNIEGFVTHNFNFEQP